MRDYPMDLKAAGVCVRCRRADAREGAVSCEPCSAKQAVRSQRAYVKRRVVKRVMRCRRCGQLGHSRPICEAVQQTGKETA